MPPAESGRSLPAPAAESPLLEWLLVSLKNESRTKVKQILKHGSVLVNGVAVTRHDHPVRPGDRIAIGLNQGIGELSRAGIAVVFEDASIVVIDKPPGLLTVATEVEKLDTAYARLAAALAARREGRPFVVHRLDRETSGLLLFARTASARDRLQKNWEAVNKTYIAVVEGKPRPAEGVVENYLIEGRDLRVRTAQPGGGAKRAISRYRVVAADRTHSLVEVELKTGRKHQIRAHMAGLGCPVIGDKTYGATTDPAGRLGLHAWRLAFDHPVDDRRVELESPIPGSLRKVGRVSNRTT
jgi:23S rRNA pseudouridine1911/1915/1917 synthase